MKKVGGLTFVRIGRFQMSFCLCRAGSNAHVTLLYVTVLALGVATGLWA